MTPRFIRCTFVSNGKDVFINVDFIQAIYSEFQRPSGFKGEHTIVSMGNEEQDYLVTDLVMDVLAKINGDLI